MQNFIIVTKEGYTLSPNYEESDVSLENLQVLGFAFGCNKKEAMKNFFLENEWVKEAGFSEVMALLLKDSLKDEDFEPFPLMSRN